MLQLILKCDIIAFTVTVYLNNIILLTRLQRPIRSLKGNRIYDELYDIFIFIYDYLLIHVALLHSNSYSIKSFQRVVFGILIILNFHRLLCVTKRNVITYHTQI